MFTAEHRDVAREHELQRGRTVRVGLDQPRQTRLGLLCAPLVDGFDGWEECWEPVRKRYID